MQTIRPVPLIDKAVAWALVGLMLAPPGLISGELLRLELVPGTNQTTLVIKNTSATNDYHVLRKLDLGSSNWSLERQVPGLGGQSSTLLSTTSRVSAFFEAQTVPAVTNGSLVLHLSNGSVTHVVGSSPVILDQNALVENFAHNDFIGGQLTLSLMTNGHVDDLLAIGNAGGASSAIQIVDRSVIANGTEIGTFSGGVGNEPLQVYFNSNATPTNVSALLQQLTFHNTSLRYSRLPRTVRFDLTDGHGSRTSGFKSVDVVCPDGIDAVVLLDVSHSLSDEAFGQMKRAATNFIGYLQPTYDRVGLVTIFGGSTLIASLTNDLVRVRQDLLALTKQSGTIFHPALSNAQNAFASSPRTNVLRVMLILSDGEVLPRSTESNAVAIAKSVKASNTRIVAAGFVNSSGLVFNDFLRELASSPTDYYPPNRSSAAPPIEIQLAAQLKAAARSICRLPNMPPMAQSQSVILPEDTSTNIVLSASDADGDPLLLRILVGPTNGVIQGAPPNLNYIPKPNYHGFDSFSFVAEDGLSESSPATVNIQLLSVNDPPVAFDQSITNSTRISFPLTLNGVDPDGDSLTFNVVAAPTNGFLNVTSGPLTSRSNHLVYTPASTFGTQDRFSFTISDGQVSSLPATVSLVLSSPECPFVDSTAWKSVVSPVMNGREPGSVLLTNCEAILTEGDSFEVRTEFNFVVQEEPGVISLTYALPYFDVRSQTLARDAFEIALVDATGRPLSQTIQGAAGVLAASSSDSAALPPRPDALFNHTDGITAFAASGVSFGIDPVTPGSSTIRIDISEIPSGVAARLVLRLVNNDEDNLTHLRITDMHFEPIDSQLMFSGSGSTALASGNSTVDRMEAARLKQDGCATILPDFGQNGNAAPPINDNADFPFKATVPTDGAVIPVGAAILNGTTRPGSPVQRNFQIAINGRAVDALDVSGSFFSLIEVRPGLNIFELTATPADGLPVTNTLTVIGNACPQNFYSLGIASASIAPEYGRTSFNDLTKVLYTEIALPNGGTDSVRTPLLVGITHISDPSIRVLSPDGISADHVPYYEFASADEIGQLPPREADTLSDTVPTINYSRQDNFLMLDWSESFPNAVVQRANIGDSSWSWIDVFTSSGNINQYRVQIDNQSAAFRLRVPRKTSLRRTLAFSNPNRIRFTYDVVVLEQKNQAPRFTTLPTLEAIVGKAYTYAFLATDSDGDALTYSLLSGPSDMLLNASNKTLSFIPAATSVGTHDILLRANDGRGGSVDQRFALNVIDPPPNRPPIFVSSPVTVARVLGRHVSTQLLDLSTWFPVNWDFSVDPNPVWELDGTNSVTQVLNGDQGVFLSDKTFGQGVFTGEFAVQDDRDDDYVGIVFGYEDSQHFYLLEWKQADQGSAEAGLTTMGISLRKFNSSSPLQNIDFYRRDTDPGRVSVLYSDRIPWETTRSYQFRVAFSCFGAHVSINNSDGALANIDLPGENVPNGHLGLFNWSQQFAVYRD